MSNTAKDGVIRVNASADHEGSGKLEKRILCWASWQVNADAVPHHT